MKRRTLNLIVAGVALLLFGVSLNRLFELRFSGGDIFPPASTRRADPIGTKALFQSLERQPGLRVRQNFERLSRIRPEAGTTLLLLGIPPQNIDYPAAREEENTHLLQFASKGGRLILGIEHESNELATNSTRSMIRRLAAPVPPGMASNRPPALDVTLGFQLKLRADGADGPAILARTNSPLPPTLRWPSSWHGSNLHPDWSPLYTREGQPVALERPWGSGSVVLLASDYHLSNESLRLEPQSRLVTWLLGPAQTVIFDETHLGLTLEPGISSLIRKYHLGGAVFGLLLLAGLHLWRTLARFNPPPDAPVETAIVVQGRGSAAGLLNILRRSVSPNDLIDVCLDDWRATHAAAARTRRDRVGEAQNVADLQRELPPRQRNPVDTYRRIARILNHR